MGVEAITSSTDMVARMAMGRINDAATGQLAMMVLKDSMDLQKQQVEKIIDSGSGTSSGTTQKVASPDGRGNALDVSA